MADSDEPTMEIGVDADFSEFDRKVEERQRQRPTIGVPPALSGSFAGEGSGVSGGRGTGREVDVSRLQRAADVYADAMERQARQLNTADRISMIRERWENLQAGKSQPERILDAASRYSGEIFSGPTHFHSWKQAVDKYNTSSGMTQEVEHGFLTSRGRFVDREEAANIARAAVQIQYPARFNNRNLASEDIRSQFPTSPGLQIQQQAAERISSGAVLPTVAAPPPFQAAPAFQPELPPAAQISMFDRAASLVRERQKATVDVLREGLSIGRPTATELMGQLEDQGVVGPYVRGKRREIFPSSVPQLGQSPIREFQNFTTALGSTYQIDEEGRTQRTKTLHPGHDTADIGQKEWSAKTYYVSPEDARELGMHGSLSGRKSLIDRSGRLFPASWNEQQQKWGLSETGRAGFEYSLQPEVGKSPIELWQPQPGSLGVEYAKWHAGNQITQYSGQQVLPPQEPPPPSYQRLLPGPSPAPLQLPYYGPQVTAGQTAVGGYVGQRPEGPPGYVASAFAAFSPEFERGPSGRPAEPYGSRPATSAPFPPGPELPRYRSLGDETAARNTGRWYRGDEPEFPLARRPQQGLAGLRGRPISGENPQEDIFEGEEVFNPAQGAAWSGQGTRGGWGGPQSAFYGSHGTYRGGNGIPGYGTAPEGGFSPEGGMGHLGLYGRFLALEFGRSAFNQLKNVRQYGIDQSLAFGDPRQLAEATLNFNQRVAGSMPLGLGELGAFINDPTGTQEGGDRTALGVAELQDKQTAVRQSYGEYSRGLQRSAEESQLPAGSTTRARKQIEDQALKDAEDAHKSQDALSTINYQVINAKRASLEIERREAIDRGSSLAYGPESLQRLFTDPKSKAKIDAYYNAQESALTQQVSGATDARNRLSGRLSDIDAKKQGDLANLQYDIGTAANALWGRSGLAGDIAAGRSKEETERNDLLRRQAQEMRDVSTKMPENIPALKTAQAKELEALDVQQQRELSGVTIQARSNVEALGLQAAFRPYEARLAQISGQGEYALSQLPPGDKIRRQAVIDSTQAELGATYAEQQREWGTREVGLEGSTYATDLAIAHLPLASRLAQIETQGDVALAQLPKDSPQKLHDDIVTQTAAQKALAEEQYRSNRFLETESLTNRENVTGILAGAYGPGARTERMRAQVEGIVGEATLRANSRLLNDANDLPNADRERRIGINELRDSRASYLQNFRAEEGSINRTALSSVTTGDPSAVLKSIDIGIKALKDQLGHLVAQD